MGIPVVGCNCAVCHSDDPRDKRTRSSVIVEVQGVRILIDTSIDFRIQALREGITHLDAVLVTHHHVDHILGLDDLRSLTLLKNYTIPLYAEAETLRHIKRVFAYIFSTEKPISDIPKIQVHEISEHPFQVQGITIIPIRLYHGPLPILGYRIGKFAYCTDVSHIPETSFQKLKGVEVLILGALRYHPHPTHFNFAQAIAAAQRIGAQHTFLTHIAHQVGHQEGSARLPQNIAIAYDGMRIAIE